MNSRLLVLGVLAGAAVLNAGQGGASAAATQEPPARKPRYSVMESQLSGLAERALRLPPSERGMLARDAPVNQDDRVALKIRVAGGTEDLLAWFKGREADVRHVFGDTVEAFVSPAELPDLAAQPGLVRVEFIRRPQPQAIESQGVRLHRANSLHAAGIRGAGVKVGVIDVGFQRFKELQMRGELPAAVVGRCYTSVGQYTGNVPDCYGTDSHGTAVSEAIVDMAPQVALYISQPVSDLDLRQTVEWMAGEGVRVICYSLAQVWEGPGNGASSDASSALRTVDRAVALNVVFVSSAGNFAQSTWTGSCTDPDGNKWLQMGESDSMEIIAPDDEETVQLRWGDAWPGAKTDLDLVVVDGAGNTVAESVDAQSGRPGDVPREWLDFTRARGTKYFVRVRHDSGPLPPHMQVQVFRGGDLARPVAAFSIATPAESANLGLLAVGASRYSNLYTLKAYSGQGPTIDGRTKPDVVAVTEADSLTSYLDGDGWNGFGGTSQAAPHVAGVVALLTQLNPELRAEQLATFVPYFADTRAPRPNSGWGYGFLSVPGDPGAGAVSFPPRDQSMAFRTELESVYRDQLKRQRGSNYADPEGSVVWTQEYLRYRLNFCDHLGAAHRVIGQIRGGPVTAACGRSQTEGQVVWFPPRNETLDFREDLEDIYRQVLLRPATPSYVDVEGDVVWISEYIRYRVSGCDHGDATARVLVQISGGGVPPVCK